MTAAVVLQREIVFIILTEVQSLGSGWNPLTGIIAKTSALTIRGTQSLFNAENLSILQLRTVDTVSACTINLFPKQHILSSGFYCFHYTTAFFGLLPVIFVFLQNNPIITTAIGIVHPRPKTNPRLRARLKTHCSVLPKK